MSDKERRNSPRKLCALPVRFRLGKDDRSSPMKPRSGAGKSSGQGIAPHNLEFQGKALNLSERGVYFTCREHLEVGQPIEMYFTLPPELTGRAPESVRCDARVVHVDEDGQAGLSGIGACVERFEPMAALRKWAN